MSAANRATEAIGKEYGRWVVTGIGTRLTTRGERYLDVVCACGSLGEVPLSSLKRGSSRQCRKCGDKAHGDFMRGSTRIGYTVAAANSVYRSYAGHAASRGHVMELTRDQFLSLTKKDCFYCGKAPSQIKYRGRSRENPYIYNGVDRMDNTKGYTLANAVPCCKMCNRIKMDHSVEELMAHLKCMLYIYEDRNESSC